MAFSSWAQVYSDLKDKIADQAATSQILQSGYTTPDGNTVTFKKLEDLTKFLNYTKTMADAEANTGGRRTGMFVAGYGGLG